MDTNKMLRMMIISSLFYAIFGFDFFCGVYRVNYPIKKMIRFTSENNEIVEKKLLVVKFHPLHKKFYLIHQIDSDQLLLLSNIYNSSDIILLAQK